MSDVVSPTARRTAAFLREMRELIADPARWTTGVEALSDSGCSVAAWSDNACRWCLSGAHNAIRNRPSWQGTEAGYTAFAALRRVAFDLRGRSIQDANDQGTHADALELLDVAIARVEGREPTPYETGDPHTIAARVMGWER